MFKFLIPTRLSLIRSALFNVFHKCCRSTHLRCSVKWGVLKNFGNFTGKHLCWNLFLIELHVLDLQLYWKGTPPQMSFCEITEIFKNTYFDEHLRTTASSVSIFLFNIINIITSNCFSRQAYQSSSSRKIGRVIIASFFHARLPPISQKQFLITLFSFPWGATVHTK